MLGTKTVCVIPARGGSKRIPGKNIKGFCGKPMIAWSIEAAKASRCFDQVIVSTDDDKVAQIAKDWGAAVPFVRPVELADDYTGTLPVLAHAVRWLLEEGCSIDYVCCLYATAPFVTARDLQDGLSLIDEAKSDYALSVTSYAFPIQRAVRVNEFGRVTMIQPENINVRSQDLEEAWHDAGQFYWGRKDAWLDQRPIFEGDAVPVKLPRHRVQDIDTLEDWQRAEWLFRANQAQGDSA